MKCGVVVREKKIISKPTDDPNVGVANSDIYATPKRELLHGETFLDELGNEENDSDH